MKSLTTEMATALAQTKKVEPMIVLRIDWGDTVGVKFYGDKDVVLGGTNTPVEGRILKQDNLEVTRYQDNFSDVGQFGIELDDSDLHFFNIMNLTALEGKTVVAYQYFPNDLANQLLVLFVGQVAAPIEWSEGELKLRFTIYSNHNDREIGTLITSDDLEDDDNLVSVLDKGAIGIMLPLAFGNCLKTKALKLFTSRQSTIETNFDVDDNVYHDNHLTNVPYIEQTLYVEEGDKWPQGVDVLFKISEILMRGQFDGVDCTIKDHNIPTDLGGAICYRDPVDPDYLDFNTVWVDTDIKLVNKWVWFVGTTAGNMINYCTAQNGQKCKFQSPFVTEFPNYDFTNPFLILLSGAIALQTAIKYNHRWPKLANLDYYEQYILPVGSAIIAEAADEYVANDLPDSEIKSVWAYRDIPNSIYNPEIDQYEQRGSRRELCAVPSSYYTIVNATYTSILFNRKLTSYQNEHWDDSSIFITQSSPVGPNTADIIEFILTNHTSLVIDTASFASVSSDIENYPSNFCIHSSKKAIELCREIAWQARCAVRIYNGTAYLVYLSKSTSGIQNLNFSNIQYKSMSITYTDTERMYTRAKAKFVVPSLNRHVKEEQLLVFQNNISTYGLKEAEWDFFIYDNIDYVRKSVDFWLRYYSNSWKKIKLVGFLNSLNLDVFDVINLVFATVYPNGMLTCRGVIEEWRYNSEKYLIDMSIWLPVLAGTTGENTSFWPSDNDGIEAVDPTADIILFDYDVPVMTQTKKNPKTYARVESVDEEVDKDGDPTGENTMTVTVLENGPESPGGTEVISGVRRADPDAPDPLVGDVFERGFLGGKDYITKAIKDAVGFEVNEERGDYLICSVINGEEESVLIAKPYSLRQTSYDQLTIDGVSYTSTGVNTRDASATINGELVEESQQITPDYSVGATIYAIRNTRGLVVQDEDGNDIKWLEANDGRSWARVDTTT